MNSEIRYVVDTAKVVSETLDQETIIINLDNGTYYSLNATASGLWELVIAGRTNEEIHRMICERYEGDQAAIEASVAQALAFLIAEKLVQEQSHEVSDNTTSPASVHASAPAPKAPFVPPLIERYEDMQEMLLADPIHDVESTGWPHIKPQNAP